MSAVRERLAQEIRTGEIGWAPSTSKMALPPVPIPLHLLVCRWSVTAVLPPLRRAAPKTALQRINFFRVRSTDCRSADRPRLSYVCGAVASLRWA